VSRYFLINTHAGLPVKFYCYTQPFLFHALFQVVWSFLYSNRTVLLNLNLFLHITFQLLNCQSSYLVNNFYQIKSCNHYLLLNIPNHQYLLYVGLQNHFLLYPLLSHHVRHGLFLSKTDQEYFYSKLVE